MVAGSNFAFKIAAKPQQIETYGYYWQSVELVIALSNGTIADPLQRTV